MHFCIKHEGLHGWLNWIVAAINLRFISAGKRTTRGVFTSRNTPYWDSTLTVTYSRHGIFSLCCSQLSKVVVIL